MSKTRRRSFRWRGVHQLWQIVSPQHSADCTAAEKPLLKTGDRFYINISTRLWHFRRLSVIRKIDFFIIPTRHCMLVMLYLAVWLGSHFTQIPSEFWIQHSDDHIFERVSPTLWELAFKHCIDSISIRSWVHYYYIVSIVLIKTMVFLAPLDLAELYSKLQLII